MRRGDRCRYHAKVFVERAIVQIYTRDHASLCGVLMA